MENSKLVNNLNGLLEYVFDSRNGYKEAEQQVADPRLKSLFSTLSTKRQAMLTTLQNTLRALGGKPVESGSLVAAAHRAFIDIKSLVTGGDRKSLANEVRRGESVLIDRYKEILNQDLPANISAVLRDQLNEIEGNLAHVEAIGNS